jgi:hypothetical protein
MVQIKNIPEDTHKLLHDVELFYQYLLEDKQFRTKAGMPVRFTERGFKEFFWAVDQILNDGPHIGKGATSKIKRNKHEIEKLLSTVKVMDELIKDPEFQFEWGEHNKKKYQKPNIIGYEHFTCPVKIDDSNRRVHFVFEIAKKDRHTREYYFHFLENKQACLGIEIVSVSYYIK